jgi:hypothetical protein
MVRSHVIPFLLLLKHREEGDGSLLSSPSLFHNTIKEDDNPLPLSFSSLTQKEGNGSKLLPSSREHH